MTAPLVQLREVCSQDRQSVPSGERPELRYLGLESIGSGSGVLNDGALSKTPAAPQANSFFFDHSHVLYGKLRPYLNKVFVPNFSGKCSTEIIPLRPSERLERDYLAYFLRSPRSVEVISAKTSGARMPRADMDYVLGLSIPLPNLQEQRQLVDILSRAEGILRLRREAKSKAAELIPSIFAEMLGDPGTNPNGWRISELTSGLESSDYGTSTKASSTKDGIAVIRMGNVNYDGSLDLEELKYVDLPEKEIEKYRLRDGDILFNRTNSKELVGKTGIWHGELDAVAASYFIRLRTNVDVLDPTYLWAFMNSAHMKKTLFATARGAIGQSNINSKELGAFAIPIPPIELQRDFALRVSEISAMSRLCNAADSKANELFSNLLSRCFSG